MISTIIDNWFTTVKKVLFKYKDGFFELPVLQNTPEIIIKSITKMPFVYHKPKLGEFGTDNPFVKAKVRYKKIDEGLWCLFSEAHYKENVSFININDKNISSDYYLLFLEINKNNVGVKKNTILNGVSYSSCSWVMTKPTSTAAQCCFKGNEITSIGIYFTEKWFNDDFLSNDKFSNNVLKEFINSDAKLIIWPEKTELAEKFIHQVEAVCSNSVSQNQTEWKNLIFNFFELFISRYSTDDVEHKLLDIAHIDRKKIQQAHQLLLDTLQGDFIGIDYIANQVGISPTKLKNNFKLVYGDSMFQYFRKRQLESAKEILSQSNMPIKEVAKMYGYISASKFSLAYKHYFGVLPSQSEI